MCARWVSDLPKNLAAKVGTSTPEQAVIQLVDTRLGILEPLNPPVNLAMVASTCGIQPKFTTANMYQDARLVLIGGHFYIQVNSAHDELRHRFSIAHEITHKIIADAMDGVLRVDDRRSLRYLTRDRDLELLCNVGARQILLMRSERLQLLILENGFHQSAVSKVEEQYVVSFEAAARSLAETAADKVAVVYFGMGYRRAEKRRVNQLPLFPEWVELPEPRLRVIRHYKSPTFDITIPRNKSIAVDSWIMDAFNKGQVKYDTEVITFDNRLYYQFDVEAIPRSFYLDGSPQQGIVIMLSNPVRQS